LDALRNKKIPAVVRFASCEPLRESLSGIDFSGFQLIIAGGESGNAWKQHIMNLEWARELQSESGRVNSSFFFKQVSARFSGQGEDALGKVYHDLPAGPFPWADEGAEMQ
jgi:protein gp37